VRQAHPCAVCSLGKNAAVHWGAGDEKHPYEGEARPAFGSHRQAISPRSESPNRVERSQEVAQARSERREAVRYCEAPAHGILTPCGTGMEARLEASHVVGLGMGGAREHGEVRMLCVRHHRDLDSDRQAFRDAGLSKRAPRPEKVVRRRWENE